ncbi:hypothetical protein BH23GEM4_BH23GEM4_23210 [soil metagenome]
MAKLTSTTDFAALGTAAAELLHDMTGLLTLIEGRTALALEQLRTGQIPTSELEVTLGEARELKAMISDVVATFGAEQRPQSFRPAELSSAEISRVVMASPAVEVRLRTRVEAEAEIAGRASFFRRALGNLLRNAIRHADSQVLVTLTHCSRGGRQGVLLAVEDDGRGISQALRDDLFAPGVHGGHGGTGLGLASAAWATDQLGGVIGHRAGPELGGARLELWFPLRSPGQSRRAPLEIATSLEGRTIALVDDDPAIRRLFERLFERVGARLVALQPPGDEVEAFADQLTALQPDIVLLDLQLGVLDGVSLWEAFALHAPDVADRTVFVSGAAGGESAELAEARTGRRVISKTLDVWALVAAVEASLQTLPPATR